MESPADQDSRTAKSTANESPDWFQKAISTPYESHKTEVDGCAINYLQWGNQRGKKGEARENNRNRPGIVLVPGGGAHAHWYAFTAPFLAQQYNVAAIDLSGTGDSGTRTEYDHETFAREVMAVAEDAGMMEAPVRPIIVGHSFGGAVTLVAGLRYGDALAGVVIIETIRQVDNENDGAGKTMLPPPRPKRIYESREEALARFRIFPPQSFECPNPFVVDYIAEHSVREENGGWAWKFDPKVFAARSTDPALGDSKERLANITCRKATIFCEYSHIVDENTLAYMEEKTGNKIPFFIVPQSGHHVMLDQPLAFVTTVQSFASQWVADELSAGERG